MSRKLVNNNLTVKEDNFVKAYHANGGNGRQAYLSVTSNSNETAASAGVRAAELLRRPQVRAALQALADKSEEEAIATRQYLIREAHDIGLEARGAEEYGSALKGVELKAKLNKLFDKDDIPLEGYINLINNIKVDVSVGRDQDEHEHIDVTNACNDE